MVHNSYYSVLVNYALIAHLLFIHNSFQIKYMFTTMIMQVTPKQCLDREHELKALAITLTSTYLALIAVEKCLQSIFMAAVTASRTSAISKEINQSRGCAVRKECVYLKDSLFSFMSVSKYILKFMFLSGKWEETITCNKIHF